MKKGEHGMRCDKEPVLKKQHTYIDFMYFKLLTAVPLVAVLVGFWRTEPTMIIPYFIWIGMHMTVVYRLLCTHCPHYGATNGKTRCQYIWSIPPVFKKRPHPQTIFEKIAINMLLLISILFPVFWLYRNLELLIIYFLSIVVLLTTMMRYECTRCIHADCSHNQTKN
jgi:hypothetical protein